MEKTPSESEPAARPWREASLWPLRLEADAVRRILDALGLQGRSCLDIGFRHPYVPVRLRRCGGYWTSVAFGRETRAQLAETLREDVLVAGAHGALPFEDKQFDVVVVALGSLTGEADDDTALMRECHRVLKAPGYLILTVAFAKPFGLAHLFDRGRPLRGAGGRYTEAALFELFKTGFDWLGTRPFCRFWVRMVWQWADRRDASGASPDVWYWLARQLDGVLFLTRGYLLTAYGRRKGWRPRSTPTLADGRSISEAVLHQLGR